MTLPVLASPSSKASRPAPGSTPGRTRALRGAWLALLLAASGAAAAADLPGRQAAPFDGHTQGQITPISGGRGQTVDVPAARGAIVVEAGSGRVVQLGAGASSVFTADPKVVEVRPASPTTLFLFGVSPGKTTVAAMDAGGRPVAQYEVVVRPSTYSAGEAGAAIDRLLPGRGVRVQQRPDGLTLQGTVATPAEADRAMSLARGYVSDRQNVENRLNVASSGQVTLRVRVAEMARNVTRQLGVNWQGLGTIGRYAVGFGTPAAVIDAAIGSTGTLAASYRGSPGGVDFNVILDALAQDQLVHLLAEPTLTALSGETASFLAGGEFPIPVSAYNNQVTVDFKQYGVSLAFVPTVMADGHISLKVRPEVSQLSDQGAVRLQAGNASISIPALTVRRAETTVELGSGQSFAIAGLLQDNATMTNRSMPWLGELPVIGALFRSDSFQRQETELVIVVTPYLSRPVSNPRAITTPVDGWRPPSDYERVGFQRQMGGSGTGSLGQPAVGPVVSGFRAVPGGPSGPAPARAAPVGGAGFMVQ